MRPDDKAEIARRFMAVRRRAFLTQRWLAELIGLSRQAVSEIEHQQVMPHHTTWDRFAALEAKHKLAQIELPVHWQ